jgi:uncharacterized membrane protein
MLPEIAIVALLLLAAIQCALLVLALRQVRQLQQQLHSMRQDVTAVSQQLAHIGHTDVPTSMLVTALGRMERRMGLLEQKQPVAPQSTGSYELAQQLARQGADVDELVARCGVTHAEALLIHQMHAAGH